MMQTKFDKQQLRLNFNTPTGAGTFPDSVGYKLNQQIANNRIAIPQKH